MSFTAQRLVFAAGHPGLKERMVMSVLAFHADEQGAAFPGLELLAREACLERRDLMRVLKRLEREEWVAIERRSASVHTARGLERKGNLYRLNMRRMSSPINDTGPSEHAAARSTVQSEDAAPVDRDRRGDKSASARCQAEVGEVTREARRGDKNGVPIKNYQESSGLNHQPEQQLLTPKAPLAVAQRVENYPVREETRAKTTTRTTATATTSSLQAPMATPTAFADVGQSSRAGRRNLRLASRDGVRCDAGLDGVDAALRAETRRVLAALDIDPDRCKGRLFRDLEASLRRRVDQVHCPVSEAGQLAIKRFTEYQQHGHLLRIVRTMGAFFVEGYWLHPERWEYDRQALAQYQRRY